MLGIVWFLWWQSMGILLCRRIFQKKRRAVRLWLGSVCGTVLSMWTPIPFAFVWGFGLAAHAAAAVFGASLLVFLLPEKRHIGELAAPEDRDPSVDRPFFRFLLPPFLALSVVLILNHTIPNVKGALYTGQCTYGDMSMHLGFISSLTEQQAFPPHYSILPYERICYPFLCDSVSASLYLLGSSLRWAYMIPMFFAFAQVFGGFWFLAREVCRKKDAPVLAFLFFFLNGGLGMIYFRLFGSSSVSDRLSLRTLFTGFYKTPTNLTEKGVRWVNVIADMLLPQRATLFGWAVLLSVLYLLFRAVFRGDEKLFLPAGILGGLLPMIHTHSFFALGLFAACWMAWSFLEEGFTKSWITGWVWFGVPAVALAIPQLLIWTVRSVGGNESFLRLSFDWVNGGAENWFWFWLKNIGPLFIITPAAFLFADREQRAAFSGALVIFVLCEFIVFQPNVYDNNKLLYAGYFFCCFLCADGVLAWLEKQRSPAVRGLSLALLLLLTANAAVFTLIREVASGIPRYGYELFDSDEVAAAEYIRENTEPDALFLTDDNHDNPVAVLTGRNILCGSPSYLFYHGLDYSQRQKTAEQMLTDPAFFERRKAESGVEYVFIGHYERAVPGIAESYFREHYPLAFSSGSIEIFDVRP